MSRMTKSLRRRLVPFGIVGIPLILMPIMAGTPAFAEEVSPSVEAISRTDDTESPAPAEMPDATGTTFSINASEAGEQNPPSPDASGGTEQQDVSPANEPSPNPAAQDATLGAGNAETSPAMAGADGESSGGSANESGKQQERASEGAPSGRETNETAPVLDAGTEEIPSGDGTGPASGEHGAQVGEPNPVTNGDDIALTDGPTGSPAPSESATEDPTTDVTTSQTGESAPVPAADTKPAAQEPEPVATPAAPAKETVKAGATVDVPEGTYVIQLGVGSNAVIDVRDGRRTTVSANIQTKKADGSASQLWDIIKSPQAGWYYIVAHGTNGALVIDVQGGKAANKTNLQLWERNGTAAQLWKFITGTTCLKGDLTNLIIVSKVGSQYVLDVYQGKTANGTNIELYKKNGTKAQAVTLVRQTKYDPKRAATKGVWIYKPSGKTTLTYWYDASGKKAKNRVVSPAEGSNGYYFATSNGAIAKGTATKVGNTIYLSAANGRLATLSGSNKQGWLDSNAFGNGKRRYYLYKHGNDGYATARYGYSTDGYPHYTCAKGHVLTGRWVDGGRIYLASSTGRMVNLASGTQRGWADANFVSGQGRRKYYLYRTTENGRYKGACYAKVGFSRDGGFHYTRSEGYVLQNATMNTWAGSCSANKAGIITTNFNTVGHVWSILEHVSRNRKKYGETARAYTINGKKEYEYDVDDVNVGIFKIRKSTIDKAQNDLLGCSQYVQVIHGIWAHGARSNDIVTKFDITYGSSRAATEKFQKNVENATKGAIKKAKSIKSASKRATYLHDWLCANARYDYSYKIYDAYGIFTKKKGVCAAYAEAYVYLCRQSGLSCEYLVGKDHAWNRVKIGNKWLYTDVTWDDCGYGHYYHLRSKAWFESHDHHQI